MEVENSIVLGPVHHRGRVHSNIGCNKGSYLVAPIFNQLLSEKTNPSRSPSVEHLLRLSKRNTPHSKSSLSHEDKTNWDAVSSYLGAHNRKEARSMEDQHKGYHRLVDEATLRTTLQSSKDNDGTTTSDQAEERRTRSRRQVEDRSKRSIELS